MGAWQALRARSHPNLECVAIRSSSIVIPPCATHQVELSPGSRCFRDLSARLFLSLSTPVSAPLHLPPRQSRGLHLLLLQVDQARRRPKANNKVAVRVAHLPTPALASSRPRPCASSCAAYAPSPSCEWRAGAPVRLGPCNRRHALKRARQRLPVAQTGRSEAGDLPARRACTACTAHATRHVAEHAYHAPPCARPRLIASLFLAYFLPAYMQPRCLHASAWTWMSSCASSATRLSLKSKRWTQSRRCVAIQKTMLQWLLPVPSLSWWICWRVALGLRCTQLGR